MYTLIILVFRGVSLVSWFEILKPINQQKKNDVKTSNFAVSTFIIFSYSLYSNLMLLKYKNKVSNKA